MGSRVPVPHYSLRAGSSYIGESLHDLNAGDAAPGEIDGISNVDRDAVTEGSLENGEESTSVDCIHETYRSSLPIHSVEVDDVHSGLENSGESSRPTYNILTLDDVVPIETMRARFLQIVVDHFLGEHVIEVTDASEVEYGHGHDKLNKRKPREIQYEGDPRFVLPLMYVANLYETLVGDANMRLATLEGVREKTIGVALEAAGGLYRKLAKKFPRKGPCSFKRRELATSLETRARFPELVVQEEKRVRFVVVNGLAIVEKPTNMRVEDAEWFKRLTGRDDISVSAQDYKFYSPRHKYRRASSQTVLNPTGLPSLSGSDTSPTLATAPSFRPVNEAQSQPQPSMKHHLQTMAQQPQFHPLQQPHHQTVHQNQHTPPFSHAHQCEHPSHMVEIPHQTPTLPQHMTCLQSLPGGHAGGRLNLLTSPAKFCDECGAPYLRETSKFCSECGVKRLGT